MTYPQTQALLTLFAAASCAGPLEDSQDLVLPHDEKLFTVDFDFRTAVFSEQHAIARFDIQGLTRAILFVFTFTNSYYFAFLRLLFRGVGDNDAPTHLLTLFDTPHNYAVMKGSDVRCHTLVSFHFPCRIQWYWY